MALLSRFPHLLAACYAGVWILLALEPVSRTVWWAENIPVLLVFGGLVLTFRGFRFSNLAYALMTPWLVLHTIGGHFTFANVPFDAVSSLFGFGRNHFDRIAHFSIGLYAFPIVELLRRKGLAGAFTSALFGIFAIMALAATYEIIEWWYADLEGGEAGIEFLGSQGDIWDAQKDMLADTLGAVCATLLHWLARERRPREPRR
jgi:putative membrane protein